MLANIIIIYITINKKTKRKKKEKEKRKEEELVSWCFAPSGPLRAKKRRRRTTTRKVRINQLSVCLSHTRTHTPVSYTHLTLPTT